MIMRLHSLLRRLVVPSLLLACGGLWSCNGFLPWSRPPVIVEQGWQAQTILVEPGTHVLRTPSVFFDAAGQPAVVLSDRAFYMGTQAIALARRDAEGWRVELPIAPAAGRVCGRAEPGGAIVVTHGDVDGPLTAARWDGTTTTSTEPGPCPAPSAERREAMAANGTHAVERSGDGRTLWHEPPGGKPCPPLDAAPDHRIEAFGLAVNAANRPVVALFERPAGDEGKIGRLRHAICGDDGWVSSIVTDGVRVAAVGLAVDATDRSHVAYVVADGSVERLVHATPVDPETPAPAATGDERDARVGPAIAACLRAWPSPPPPQGVEVYQQGDALRCAVLERDPATSQQALAALGPRCDGGEAPACALAGALHHHLMGDVEIVLELPTGDGTTRLSTEWRGLRATGVPEDLGQAASFYGRACDAGEARACLYHAVLLPPDDPQRLARATTACEAELPHGCALAVAAASLRPDQALADRAQAVLRTACDAGDAAACNDLGVVLHVRGDAAAARAAIDGACQSGLEPACRNLERLR